MRRTTVERSADGRCTDCSRRWNAPNAQAVAAIHHDKSGHTTEVTVTMVIRYGSGRSPSARPSAQLPLGSDGR